MTDAPKIPNFTEAPASWTVKYFAEGGWDAMLTLRGETGSDVLIKSQAALKWLGENGAQPTKPTNGNGKPAAAPKMDNGQPDPAWCPIHSVVMSRHEKNSQVWHSHKIGENEYCRGK
jgi:hypothetical protein